MFVWIDDQELYEDVRLAINNSVYEVKEKVENWYKRILYYLEFIYVRLKTE